MITIGEDPNNHTLKILKLLRKLDKSICKKITINTHPNPKSIIDECNEFHANFLLISSQILKSYFCNIKIAFLHAD